MPKVVILIEVRRHVIQLHQKKRWNWNLQRTLRCVIPRVCVINKKEESAVKQHNLFRKILYSNNVTTRFGLQWPSSGFYND